MNLKMSNVVNVNDTKKLQNFKSNEKKTLIRAIFSN